MHSALLRSPAAWAAGAFLAGFAPRARVCWRVEAVRNDRWVQMRGAPVEVDKPEAERGQYPHPERNGQPAETRVNFNRVTRLAPLEFKENR